MEYHINIFVYNVHFMNRYLHVNKVYLYIFIQIQNWKIYINFYCIILFIFNL